MTLSVHIAIRRSDYSADDAAVLEALAARAPSRVQGTPDGIDTRCSAGP